MMAIETLWAELLPFGKLVKQGWLTRSAGVQVLRLPNDYLVKQRGDWITTSHFESEEELEESEAYRLLAAGAERHGLRAEIQMHRVDDETTYIFTVFAC